MSSTYYFLTYAVISVTNGNWWTSSVCRSTRWVVHTTSWHMLLSVSLMETGGQLLFVGPHDEWIFGQHSFHQDVLVGKTAFQVYSKYVCVCSVINDSAKFFEYMTTVTDGSWSGHLNIFYIHLWNILCKKFWTVLATSGTFSGHRTSS